MSKKKQAKPKTELSVKANKIMAKAVAKAKKGLEVASNNDIAKALAHSRAEMKVINATKETSEELNRIRAKIDANSERGAELREEFSAAFERLFPAEFAKETTLKKIKSALIAWVSDRKETTVNGVVVKTYEDGLRAYQICIEQQQMAATATATAQ